MRIRVRTIDHKAGDPVAQKTPAGGVEHVAGTMDAVSSSMGVSGQMTKSLAGSGRAG